VDVGLGDVDNVQQATKTEFNAHNNDNTRHITTNEERHGIINGTITKQLLKCQGEQGR